MPTPDLYCTAVHIECEAHIEYAIHIDFAKQKYRPFRRGGYLSYEFRVMSYELKI